MSGEIMIALQIVILKSLLIPSAAAWLLSKLFYRKVKRHYLKVLSTDELTTKDIIYLILNYLKIENVQIKSMSGKGLKACYRFPLNTIELTQDLLDSHSVTSITIAAHECGHVYQYTHKYKIVLANFWQNLWVLSIFVAQMTSHRNITNSVNILYYFVIGIIVTGFILSLYNCWIEFDASRKAILWMNQLRILDFNSLAAAQLILDFSLLNYITGSICCWLISINFLFQMCFGG